MKKSFAILGLGVFGLELIKELKRHNVEIIGIDYSEENASKAGEIINNVFVCDITNEKALKELAIDNVDHAVVAVGSNFQATIMATIILKELKIKKITVRVDDEYYVPVIKKLGATEVISPQKLAAVRLANKIISDSFIDYFDISDKYCVVEVNVEEDVRPLRINEIDPRNKFSVNLLLIRRKNDIIYPTGEDYIMAKDNIFVFGSLSDISRFSNSINIQKVHK